MFQRVIPALILVLLLLFGSSCMGTNSAWSTSTRADVSTMQMHPGEYVPDLPINSAPFAKVQASWKQTVDQPYVYLEHHGSYTRTGSLIPTLQRELMAQGLEASGPPFALYYDDPADTAVGDLVSRACFPISAARSPLSPLRYDMLRSVTVAYAFVSGAYPDAPRVYPGIYAFMKKMHWVDNGPIREVYLVAPQPGVSMNELICEVQIPSAPEQH
ncbi:MAG: DNA gyrase inhibitor GyrI [Planctomycetota bacterium]|jgi:DNA gyrase inhibitor GyrI